MELMDAINNRRSIRAYKPDAVEKEKIELILHAAVQAPSAMNQQPWAFGVIRDRKRLDDYSERVKAFLLSKVDEWSWLGQYQDYFKDPNYHVFYKAPTLVIIYARIPSEIARIDCTLAAENLMLAACGAGLGSCWIGFAHDVLNSTEVKQELGVPDEYSVMAPIIIGYPEGPAPDREKKPAEVIFWI